MSTLRTWHSTRSALLFTLIIALGGGACDHRLPEGHFLCDPTRSNQCPSGWVCQKRGTDEAFYCYSSTGGYCGDGELNAGEQCDGLYFEAEQPCDTGFPICAKDCTVYCTVCGNGIIEVDSDGVGEQCEGGEYCTSECLIEHCGSGTVDPDEACDDGNNVSGDGCSADCTSDERCGNGILDTPAGEVCDDGDTLGQDGCSAECQLELPEWFVEEHQERDLPTTTRALYDPGAGSVLITDPEGVWRYLNGRWFFEAIQPPSIPGYSEWFKYPGDFMIAHDPSRNTPVVVAAPSGNRCLFELVTGEWREVFNSCGGSSHPAVLLLFYDLFWSHLQVLAIDHPQVAIERPSESDNSWSVVGQIDMGQNPPWVWVHDTNRQVLVGVSHDSQGSGMETWEVDGIQPNRVLTSTVPQCELYLDSLLVYDPDRGKTVLLCEGGTYEFDGQNWVQYAHPLPQFRADRYAAAYDATAGYLLLYEQECSPESCHATWAYHGAGDWEFLHYGNPEPIARMGHGLLYDEVGARSLLFGGRGADPLGDFWSNEDGQWLPLSSTGGPSPRSEFGWAADDLTGEVVLFGGWGSAGVLSDTWRFDGNQWHQELPDNSPPARSRHVLVSLGQSNRLLLFGGWDGSAYLDDTWTYDGSQWTQVSSFTTPSARAGHTMVYDELRDRVVLFGGEGTSGVLADTWEFDGTQWTRANPSSSPAARTDAAMTVDPGNGRVYLLGGRATTSKGDLWFYDGLTWRVLGTLSGPEPRHGHAIAWDARERSMLLMGGELEYPGSWLVDTQRWRFRFAPATALESHCGNGIDDDGDGYTDCQDDDCFGRPGPGGGTCQPDETFCGDGTDNDGDGLVDCADPGCDGHETGPGVPCGPEELCEDGYDNDGNGLVDCNDAFCCDDPWCEGQGVCQ